MRYALISDIHGNLPALKATLADISARAGITATWHLGDLVGYAPWPNEVVSLLGERQIHGVAGNYDSTVAAGYEHCGCRYEDSRQEERSHLSYAWTRANVIPDTIARLAALPFRIDIRPSGGHAAGRNITLVHGNHVLNTVYVTEDRSDGFLRKMAASVGASPGDVVCFGHTHVPWHRVVDDVHFVNTGSVGRPKDGDARAGYILLDVSGPIVQVEFVRVDYDVEAAASAIIASDLPDEFADFLRTGGRQAFVQG